MKQHTSYQMGEWPSVIIIVNIISANLIKEEKKNKHEFVLGFYREFLERGSERPSQILML